MTRRDRGSRRHTPPAWTTARLRYAAQRQMQHPPPAPSSGVSARLRTGYRLVSASPGLSIYLLGGVGVWLGYRLLASQAFAHGFWGGLFVGSLRLAALLVVVLAYFLRTGQLADVGARLRSARSMVATQHGTVSASVRSFLKRRLP